MKKNYRNLIDGAAEYVKGLASEGYSVSEAEAFAYFTAEEAVVADTPLTVLYDVFSCNAFERVAVTLGLAAALDGEIASCLHTLFGVPMGCVTPAVLCCAVFGSPSLVECAVLFDRNGVLDHLFTGTAMRTDAVMNLRHSVVQFLLTGEAEEDWILPQSTEGICDPYAEKAAHAAASALSRYSGEVPAVINIHGITGIGKRTVLRRASELCGMEFLLIRAEALTQEMYSELLPLLALTGKYPALFTEEGGENVRFTAWLEKLAEDAGLVVVISTEPLSADNTEADVVPVPVELPSTAEQTRIWQRKSRPYPLAEDVNLEEIAMEFRLPPGDIDRVFRFASLGGGTITSADIKRGCYSSVGTYMGSRAVKVNCGFTWDDLVLPSHSKKILRTACDYVRYGCTVYEKWNFGGKLPYGRGASMIFTGPPGTGKTMAAQVMANELELELYKVNLASVVSKYIGETEKNLNEIFERARRSRVVLFFDEADVLFSKRTEVKDSNDKYSNMESAFLLQKIEEFTGIAILATNFVQNFDEAFKRRMKFLVEFPFPDKKQRSEIWQKVFPPEAPVGTLDFEYLVENFTLSGSNIKNIALHAAFLAASGGAETIEMQHIVSALKNEFAKSGKSFTKAEAGEYFYYLDD